MLQILFIDLGKSNLKLNGLLLITYGFAAKYTTTDFPPTESAKSSVANLQQICCGTGIVLQIFHLQIWMEHLQKKLLINLDCIHKCRSVSVIDFFLSNVDWETLNKTSWGQFPTSHWMFFLKVNSSSMKFGRMSRISLMNNVCAFTQTAAKYNCGAPTNVSACTTSCSLPQMGNKCKSPVGKRPQTWITMKNIAWLNEKTTNPSYQGVNSSGWCRFCIAVGTVILAQHGSTTVRFIYALWLTTVVESFMEKGQYKMPKGLV